LVALFRSTKPNFLWRGIGALMLVKKAFALGIRFPLHSFFSTIA